MIRYSCKCENLKTKDHQDLVRMILFENQARDIEINVLTKEVKFDLNDLSKFRIIINELKSRDLELIVGE